jgi:hypothetical protein
LYFNPKFLHQSIRILFACHRQHFNQASGTNRSLRFISLHSVSLCSACSATVISIPLHSLAPSLSLPAQIDRAAHDQALSGFAPWSGAARQTLHGSPPSP